MAAGIGIDIVDIARIERLLTRYGLAFTRRVFTPHEAAYCGAMARPAVHYAGRFAVKEAFYKALPPSCQARARWRSIETLPGSDGRPALRVLNYELSSLLTREGITTMLVSISHERQYCVAMVMLSGLAYVDHVTVVVDDLIPLLPKDSQQGTYSRRDAVLQAVRQAASSTARSSTPHGRENSRLPYRP